MWNNLGPIAPLYMEFLLATTVYVAPPAALSGMGPVQDTRTPLVKRLVYCVNSGDTELLIEAREIIDHILELRYEHAAAKAGAKEIPQAD